MDTMRSLIFYGPGDIKVEQRPVPVIGPGEALLKVGATSVCASDIRVYRGEKKAKPGVITGHEFAGRVAQVGEGVTEAAVGDRVIVCPIIACGACYYCQIGRRNRCLKRVTLGYDEDGGFADYVRIPAELVRLGHMIPLDSELPYELASITEPMACVLNSLESCKVTPGCTMAILGCGPMGLMHLVLGKAMGAAKIIMSDPVEERRHVAEELGATMALDPAKFSIAKETQAATHGLGADAGFLSIGIAELVEEGLGAVRKEGYFNLFAGFPPSARINMEANRIHYDEIFMTGTQNATTDHYVRVSHMLPHLPGALRLITNRYQPEEANLAYEARLGLSGLKSVVLYDEA